MTPKARRALFHFLAIGGLVALGTRWLAPDPQPAPIVIDAARVAALHSASARASGASASPDEAAAWLAAYVDDEILYREALARGYDAGDPVIAARLAQNAGFLGIADERGSVGVAREIGLVRGDLVVRRRLVQRMRAAVEASARAGKPTELELADYLAAHVGRFETPPRVSFRHVCFSPERRADPEAAAHAALRAWRRVGTVPTGDPCLAPSEQPLQTEADLARYFGADFGPALFDLAVGEWAGPLPAPGAFHLVRVSERQPARVPPLPEVESRVRAALQSERADAAVRAFLAERRTVYEVSVAGAAGTSTP